MTVGAYLKEKRNDKGLTLMCVAEIIGVTANYISLIERGKNTPNDEIITKLADLYEIDEDDLFERFDKVPASIMKEVKKYKYLRKAISEISRKEDITEQDKEDIYKSLLTWNERAMKEKDK
ncbi:helix-turn-helix transcriptional regulator [Priestia megaterium]|uniref:helix-turn-helix domain-containing protein n=1 Tax=Priestia megaterium TaxID=1404 RepID=UPI002041983D|nr:helix-turn-helix transcriptional regulator [Priestia megaterium]MCM3155623.1 helix-turn-helix transcriptional regulator [Priestia megaterium]